MEEDAKMKGDAGRCARRRGEEAKKKKKNICAGVPLF